MTGRGYGLADMHGIAHDVWDRLAVDGATALIDSGCLHAKGLTAWMADKLRENGDGKVYVVDDAGRARYGANGLMTSAELAAEARGAMPRSWPGGR